MVEVVSQELSTGTASVPIVHSEEGTCWPRLVLSMLRFHNVQDYRNSVFVVIAYEALVGVGCVGSHDAIPLVAALGWFVVGDNDAGAGGKSQCCGLLLIFVHHLVGVDYCQSSDLRRLSRVGVNFVLHIDALPIPLEQFFEVLLPTYKFLACTSA